MIARLKQIIKDRDRKSLVEIFLDFIKLGWRYKNRSGIHFYVIHLMYKKDAGKIEDYFFFNKTKLLKRDYIYPKNNPYIKANTIYPKGVHPILYNKLDLAEYLAEGGIPIPKLIGKLKSGKYFDHKSRGETIKNSEHLKQIINEKIFPKYKDFFIKKAVSRKGEGTFKISKPRIDRLNNIDIKGEYILEETIEQHEYLSTINPSCINSLRVITCRAEGKVTIVVSLLRVGKKGAYKDNSSAGGIFIPFDFDTNTLNKKGYTHYLYGGHTFLKHPDTGFVFENQPLPFVNEIKELCIHAARLFELPIIGWDVAITPNGPVIIEGNQDPGRNGQIAAHGYNTVPIYRQLIKKSLKK